MSNHFYLLVRVPHRPEGFDVPLEVILARLERAIGDKSMALMRTQLGLWTRSGLTDTIEEWRQRQLARMFNLSGFVRCVKLRFCLLRRLCENGFAWFQPLSRRAVPLAQPEAWPSGHGLGGGAKVGVKATTNERMGFPGREEGMCAMAIATVDLPL